MELITHVRKKSLISESFRTTLTSILFSARDGDRPRVLVLTSASPKEGKTTVVAATLGHCLGRDQSQKC